MSAQGMHDLPITHQHLYTVYLGLGTNLGEREKQLALALEHLRSLLDIEAVSSIYETEPVDFLDQPRFLNMVCSGKTHLSAQELLHAVKALEALLGRQPTFRYGPRAIDIDILLYDDLQLQQDGLTIPHPRMAERAFVLVPLAEIAPQIIDPASGKSIHTLLKAISQQDVRFVARLHAQS